MTRPVTFCSGLPWFAIRFSLVGCLGFGSPARAESPSVYLPAGTDPIAWSAAASMLGLRLSSQTDAQILIQPGRGRWQLTVRGTDGRLREMSVAAPENQADREEILILALSLRVPLLPGALTVPVVPTPAVVAIPRDPTGDDLLTTVAISPASSPPLVARKPNPTPAPSALPAPTPAPSALPAPTPAPSALPAPTPAPSALPAPTPAPSALPAPTPVATLTRPESALSNTVVWVGGGLSTPAAETWLAVGELGARWPISPDFALGLAVLAESPTFLPEIANSAKATRLRGELSLDLRVTSHVGVGTRMGVAAHIFSDDAGVRGALWSPEAGLRFEWAPSSKGLIRPLVWAAGTAEFFRVTAAQGSVEIPVSRTSLAIGVSILVDP